MDRNRDSRRVTTVVSSSNGRRYRTNSLSRGSPDDELHESVRLRDRVKKDGELRERPSRIVKRKRNERSTSNRVDTGNDEETSEESVSDEEEDDDDDDDDDDSTAAAADNHRANRSRNATNSNNISNNYNLSSSAVAHHLQHGRSYAASKAFRAPSVWRSGDEVISVSVPRKARSSSAKRSYDWISSSSNNNSGGGGEQIMRQASDSPARRGVASTSNQPPTSSSHASTRKKLKHAGNINTVGPKQKPSNREELEIEIAEVLSGLKTKPQGPCKKEDVNNRSSIEAKLHHHPSPVSGPNPSPLIAAAAASAPKRKRPRQVPENQSPKIEISWTSNVDKQVVISQARAVQPPEPTPQLFDSELRDDTSNLLSKEEILSPEEKESAVEGIENEVSTSIPTPRFSKVEAHKEEKYEIDLMAPPPQLRSSPEREAVLDSSYVAADPKCVPSAVNTDLKVPIVSKENDENGSEKIRKPTKKEAESSSPSVKASKSNGLSIDLQLDLEKPEIDQRVNAVENKFPNLSPPKAVREDQIPERHAQSTSSVLLPLPFASWPGGFPPMGYLAAAPLQGVAPMNGAAVTSQPVLPRLKRCATHCQIARGIHCYQQQFMKMNPFWPGSPLFGPRPGSDPTVKALTNGPQNPSTKTSPSQTSDSWQKKQQQVLIQQALPPHVASNNLMGSGFIFPLSQQQAAFAKPATTASLSSVANVGPNEPQLLAINGYPFPIPPPGIRGPPGHPMFNGSFFPQMLHHPPQLQQQQQQPCVSHDANVSNTTSSSSQKQQQQQQRAPPSTGNLRSFASSQKPSSHDNHPPAVNVYSQKFSPMPPSSAAAAYGASSNQSEKRINQAQQQQEQLQQQGAMVKNVVESLAPHHGFAMSYGPSIDKSSMVQSHHAIMSAAAAASKKKNVRVSEDGGKSNGGGGDSSNASTNEDERKVNSITFSRSDFSDNSSHVLGSSRASTTTVNAHNIIQSQIQQQQQQQILHLKHQQAAAAAANRGSSKGPVNSSCSSSAAKFPVMHSPIQSSHQSSHQWKGVQPPLGSSSSSTCKGGVVQQQSSRSQPPVMHAQQISFAGNHNKPNTSAAAASQGQGQGHSAPMMMPNSPTTSLSMLKGEAAASGSSPRTSASTNSKMSQQGSSTTTQQHRKNSPSSVLQSQRPPSILGNTQLNPSSNSGAKAQVNINSQQQQKQMMAKSMQHAQQQLFFSNPFGQLQSSNNNTCGAGVYLVNQTKRADKNQQQHVMVQAMTTSNGGILSLSSTSTTDPAKAIAAAASVNASQGVFAAAAAKQFGAQKPGGFSYAQQQPVVVSVQMKPSSEQKQPAAGNETARQP